MNRLAGQVCLQAAFVLAGYSGFAYWLAERTHSFRLRKSALMAAVGAYSGLMSAIVILSIALWNKDFSFQYVAQYSSRLLAWYFSLSALWVGQAGSLLLWAWLLASVAMAFRFWPSRRASALRDPAFGILMAFCSFLAAIMVFAADPFECNIAPGGEGNGLSPLLQHPAMLIHPPIVFLGYAVWAVPCAVAIAALQDSPARGVRSMARSAAPWLEAAPLTLAWVRLARPWSLAAWAILGAGILIGAYWSYEELGWGGYWAWDPVENGSLIPWLTGSALIHTMMVWQHRGILKKSSLGLAILTFGMCNFATFLTRSGIFSSLHAFSESPIGWFFLGSMLFLAILGAWRIFRMRPRLEAAHRFVSLCSREALIAISLFSLLLLAGVTLVGTLWAALSHEIVGRRIVLGPAFYDAILAPLGIVLLLTMAAAPLLRWGAPPRREQWLGLLFSAGAATGLGVASALSGIRHPLWFAIVWLAWFAVAALLAGLAIECWNNRTRGLAASLGRLLLARRNSLAGFTIHLGLAALAVGVTGSSLCSQRTEVVMKPGDVRAWNGQTIRFERLEETDYADKHVVAAALQIERPNARPIFLFPAQHYHWLQSQWTTEVAIHSTWQSDLYAILHQGEKDGGIRLTLLLNPMMRWLWAGGTVMVLGAGLRLAPALLLGWRRASMPLRGRGTVPLVRSHPGLSDAPNSSPLRSGSRRRSA